MARPYDRSLSTASLARAYLDTGAIAKAGKLCGCHHDTVARRVLKELGLRLMPVPESMQRAVDDEVMRLARERDLREGVGSASD